MQYWEVVVKLGRLWGKIFFGLINFYIKDKELCGQRSDI
jgi:hypothetical protein